MQSVRPKAPQYIRAWIFAALALAAGAAPARAQQTTWTPQHVAKLRAVLSAVVSPDGGHVAYVLSVPRGLPGQKDGPAWAELHVVDARGNSRPFVTGEVNVDSVQWTP